MYVCELMQKGKGEKIRGNGGKVSGRESVQACKSGNTKRSKQNSHFVSSVEFVSRAIW
jgi:hypothetical protein